MSDSSALLSPLLLSSRLPLDTPHVRSSTVEGYLSLESKGKKVKRYWFSLPDFSKSDEVCSNSQCMRVCWIHFGLQHRFLWSKNCHTLKATTLPIYERRRGPLNCRISVKLRWRSRMSLSSERPRRHSSLLRTQKVMHGSGWTCCCRWRSPQYAAGLPPSENMSSLAWHSWSVPLLLPLPLFLSATLKRIIWPASCWPQLALPPCACPACTPQTIASLSSFSSSATTRLCCRLKPQRSLAALAIAVSFTPSKWQEEHAPFSFEWLVPTGRDCRLSARETTPPPPLSSSLTISSVHIASVSLRVAMLPGPLCLRRKALNWIFSSSYRPHERLSERIYSATLHSWEVRATFNASLKVLFCLTYLVMMSWNSSKSMR